MFVGELKTDDQRVRLIAPNVERDAPLSLRWLAGPVGRETLRLMGMPDEDNYESTLEAERKRIEEFLGDNGELDWMIELDGAVVGAIWIHTHDGENIKAPAISMMLGDATARGHGTGRAAFAAVLGWLKDVRHEHVVYARHLLENAASRNLSQAFGFVDDGEPYVDHDGLHWQNVRLNLKENNS